MKRREFLAGLAGTLASPGAALAQADPLESIIRVVTNGAPSKAKSVTEP